MFTYILMVTLRVTHLLVCSQTPGLFHGMSVSVTVTSVTLSVGREKVIGQRPGTEPLIGSVSASEST